MTLTNSLKDKALEHTVASVYIPPVSYMWGEAVHFAERDFMSEAIG